MSTSFILERSALAAALTVCAVRSASGQQHQDPLPQVVVTGSGIERARQDGAWPVTVLTRAAIEASGASTVRQLLDTVPAFDSGALRDDGSANSFARGASGASLRGLGKGATLVLLNGRRLSHYPFADSGKELFVNVDALPAAAVERIEVLKGGASAMYGSEAMAGVINIITRRGPSGVGLAGHLDRPQSHPFGGQQGGAVSAAVGDAARDGYSVFASLEAYRRRGYLLGETVGSYPAWHKRFVSPGFGDPSLASFPGNLHHGAAGGLPGLLIREAVAGCPASRINPAGLCVSDLGGLTSASDSAERINLFSQARIRLGHGVRGLAELAFAASRTSYRALPYATVAGAPSYWFNGVLGRSEMVPKPQLAVGNPANPYPFEVGIDYRFLDYPDMWEAPAQAQQYRALASLDGTLGNGVAWQVGAGRSGADARSRERGAHRSLMPLAVNSGAYVLGGPNSRDLLERMFPRIGSDASASQDFIDGRLSGRGMTLAGGPLLFVAGAELRRERLLATSSGNLQNAEIIGRGPLLAEGERRLAAWFVELDAPFTGRLALNGAVRADKADGFRARFSPALGLRYRPRPAILLRGALSAGFRAPGIAETSSAAGVTGYFNGTADPRRCATATRIRDILRTGGSTDISDATVAYNAGCLTSVPAMIASNPDLAPETSTSLTLGLLARPFAHTELALDFFRIERRHEIAHRSVGYVLAREDQPGYGALIVRNPVSANERRLAARANELSPGAQLAFEHGSIQSLLLNYENVGKSLTSGVDLELSHRVSLQGKGSLAFSLMTTVALRSMQWDIEQGAYRPNTVGLRGMPKYTSVYSAVWQRGPLTAGASVYRTSRTELNFDETDAARWGEAGCRRHVAPTDELPCFVGAAMRADLHLAYSAARRTRVTLHVRNALNTAAPVDLRGGYALRPRSLKLGLAHQF